MSDHPIDILFRAKDQASRTIANVNRELGLFGRASKGAQTAARNLGRIGAVGLGVGAAAGVIAIRSGLESLAERENVIAATENAIKATGQAATLSAAQVRAWSEALETATGAAVDDKAIQAGANTLIRFGVASERALAAATDLGAGLKSGPEQGAKLLGKALADPIKGMTALRRAGVILTASEEKHIKTLMKQGKEHKAQAALLAAVEARYKGAAAASAGPYTRSLNLLSDTAEDAKMALAEGFLPVIERLSGKLRTALDDPATMRALRDIGEGLADAADGAIDFVSGLPWDKIKDGLGKAADFAKSLVGAFTSLPPEAQATIIALAGLDKLSGGAVSGIVGELGKGLIKGVLGMTAGVVNINAGVVNGGGGGGIPGTGGGGKGGGKIGSAVKALPIIGLGAIALGALYDQGKRDIDAGRKPMQYYKTESGQLAYGWPPDALDATKRTEANTAEGKKKQAEAIVAFRDGERTSQTGLSNVATTTRTGAAMTAMAQAMSAARIVSAIAANRPVTNVYVYASGASVRYGSSTGSAGRSSNVAKPGQPGVPG